MVSEYEKFHRLCDSISGQGFTEYSEGKLKVCETRVNGQTIAKVTFNTDKNELEKVEYDIGKMAGTGYPVYAEIYGKDIKDVDNIGTIQLMGTGNSLLFFDIRQ